MSKAMRLSDSVCVCYPALRVGPELWLPHTAPLPYTHLSHNADTSKIIRWIFSGWKLPGNCERQAAGIFWHRTSIRRQARH